MTNGGKKDPAMLFYGADFYEDEAVLLMSLEQEALYLRLLWHSWREGGIPAAVDDIAAIVKVPPKRFAKLWGRIAAKWVPSDVAGRLINRRQEHERKERAERTRKLSEAGVAGNERRWGSRSPGDADPKHVGDRNAIPPIPIPSSPTPSGTSVPPPRSGEGLASPEGGTGERGGDVDPRELEAMRALLGGTPLRSKAKNRRQIHDEIAGAMAGDGMGSDQIRRLIAKAKAESNGDYGALLASWLKPGAWQDKWAEIVSGRTGNVVARVAAARRAQ